MINADIIEEYQNMLKEIADCELKDDAIMMINYDNGMGISIDWWERENKIEF